MAAAAVLLAAASPLLVTAHGALHPVDATPTCEAVASAEAHGQGACPICVHFSGAQRAPLVASPAHGLPAPMVAGTVALAGEPLAIPSHDRTPAQPRAPPFAS